MRKTLIFLAYVCSTLSEYEHHRHFDVDVSNSNEFYNTNQFPKHIVLTLENLYRKR